jgi:3-methyladenine DNA glycosylase/8-oxoguanine DNA glycosylase
MALTAHHHLACEIESVTWCLTVRCDFQADTEKLPTINGVKPVSPEQEELIHRLVYFQNEYEQPSEEDLKRITVRVLEFRNRSSTCIKNFFKFYVIKFYGTRRFITVFTIALHWSLSCARSIQSIQSHPVAQGVSK